MTHFLIIYTCLFLFCTATIVGFYLATRGDYETLVDGSKKRRGRLLRAWSIFWDQTKAPRLVPYKGKAFHDLMKKAIPIISSTVVPENAAAGGEIMYRKDMLEFSGLKPISDCKRELIEHELGAQIYIHTPSDRRVQQMYFTKEYVRYRFPEWVRHPVASCVTCFSSIYGSAFYWLAIWQINENIFAWSNAQLFSKLYFWAVFCFSLSCSTTFIVKKMNNK